MQKIQQRTLRRLLGMTQPQNKRAWFPESPLWKGHLPHNCALTEARNNLHCVKPQRFGDYLLQRLMLINLTNKVGLTVPFWQLRKMRFRKGSEPPKLTKQRNNGTVSRITNSFSFARTCLVLALEVPHPGKHLCHGKQGQLVTQPELKPMSACLHSHHPLGRRSWRSIQLGLTPAAEPHSRCPRPGRGAQEPCHFLSQASGLLLQRQWVRHEF